MSYLSEMGQLSVGSQLKSLSDRFYAMGDQVYRENGSPLQARWFPILRLLHDRGPQAVTEVAVAVGQTHSAISQLAGRLERDGWIVTEVDAADRRMRRLRLSPRAEQVLRAAKPIWHALAEELHERLARSDVDVAAALTALDEVLGDGLVEAIGRRMAANLGAVEILPFTPELRAHFYRLNADWLERYFHIEELDHEVLSDPEGRILAPGGRVWFARIGDEVVGTCALVPDGHGGFELAKMAVDPVRQGLGIGRKLIEAAIAAFEEMGGRSLHLETNTKLTTAIRLYESVGFEHRTAEGTPQFQRANVFMVWRGRRGG